MAIFAGAYLVFGGIMARKGDYVKIRSLVPKQLQDGDPELQKSYLLEISPFFFICGGVIALSGIVSAVMRAKGSLNSTIDLAFVLIMLVCCLLLGLRMKLLENKYQ